MHCYPQIEAEFGGTQAVWFTGAIVTEEEEMNGALQLQQSEKSQQKWIHYVFVSCRRKQIRDDISPFSITGLNLSLISNS